MRSSLAGALALGVMMFVGTSAMAEAPGDPKAVKSTDGKYFDAKGDPTYNVGADGTVRARAMGELETAQFEALLARARS